MICFPNLLRGTGKETVLLLTPQTLFIDVLADVTSHSIAVWLAMSNGLSRSISSIFETSSQVLGDYPMAPATIIDRDFGTSNNLKENQTMKVEKDGGYKCPRCDDRIPEQFYCLNCGYVPNWRQIEMYKTHRDAA